MWFVLMICTVFIAKTGGQPNYLIVKERYARQKLIVLRPNKGHNYPHLDLTSNEEIARSTDVLPSILNQSFGEKRTVKGFRHGLVQHERPQQQLGESETFVI